MLRALHTPVSLVAACLLGVSGCTAASAASVQVPDPIAATPHTTVAGRETVVFAGGCFWGIQAVFEHVKGVIRATSGYSGGEMKSPDYETVSSGRTGHAESVEVVFDPSQVSYTELLKVFFSVAHNPTELNRQGPDVGTQYRSAIFYETEEQHRATASYIAQLTKDKVFPRPIVTQVMPFAAFYTAEEYHQDYAFHHPNEPYIAFNDLPKVEHLKVEFPALYRADGIRWTREASATSSAR